MGIFGIAKKGFGLLGKKSSKVSPTIKSVKPSFKKKDVKGERYYENIKKVNTHRENIKKGKESVKALHSMTKTRQAYFIGKKHGATTKRIYPYDPKQGKKQIGED